MGRWRALVRWWGLMVVLAAWGCGAGGSRQRVLVLGLDGIDPGTVDLLLSEGQLPSFARLRQEGAYGRLRSEKPLLSPIIWTTIATGQTPDRHGIGHFVAEDLATGREIPATSEMRRVPALWTIASGAGLTSAVVGWWATWPPEPIRGWVVSDRASYHFLSAEGLAAVSGEEVTSPPDLAARIAPMLRRPADLEPKDLEAFVDVPAAQVAEPFSYEDELGHFRWALAASASYGEIGLTLWRENRPDLGLVYIEGVDSASHLFGHLFRAEGLQGDLAAQQERYGGAVEAMYRFADELVGRYLEAIDADTTLVVLSDHGFELGALHDDPSIAKSLRRVSERFHREEGILYLYGAGVRRHARLEDPSILDVTPTVLTLLGLPAAADMPGRVLSEGLSRRPQLARVPSYGGPSLEETGGRLRTGDDAVRRAQIDRLRSLGYLGGSATAQETGHRSPRGDRNLAAVLFRQGRLEEAEALYRRLLLEDDTNVALLTSLAGVIASQVRYEEAARLLERAIELEPLNPEAFHNLGVIAERQGREPEAADLYRRGLRGAPGYEPSRQALLRLTGTADPGIAGGVVDEGARALAEAASDLARRGAYDEAMQRLDEAVLMAPLDPLVHQYRANVAYLMGDLEAAVEALEQGLEIVPDDALFRENLDRLRARAADEEEGS